MIYLAILNVILIVLLVYLLIKYKVYKKKSIKQNYGYTFSFPSPIKRIKVSSLDDAFEANHFGATTKASVQFIGKGSLDVLGATSDTESWILSVLSKNASNMFEFGTCTGRTTYLWAINSPSEAKITTITLSRNDTQDYKIGADDNPFSSETAVQESVFENFLYENKPESYKIAQLFGDSKLLDETPYANMMDLVFIDGSHAYSYVKSDTEKAIGMLKEGGLIVWHDYRGPYECEDVYRFLNELSLEIPLMHIEGTSMVCYRKTQH